MVTYCMLTVCISEDSLVSRTPGQLIVQREAVQPPDLRPPGTAPDKVCLSVRITRRLLYGCRAYVFTTVIYPQYYMQPYTDWRKRTPIWQTRDVKNVGKKYKGIVGFWGDRNTHTVAYF
jgi:hypothetical protein